MPKKVINGTGLMEREATVFSSDDPQDVEHLIAAFDKWAKSLPVAKPDDWAFDGERREGASVCRQTLATVGLDDDGRAALDTGRLRQRGLAEDSAQWLAAQWLAAYNGLMKARDRLAQGDTSPSNMGVMLYHAENLGKIKERMWWRRGIDRSTGTRREQLAIERRNNRKAFADASMERNAANIKKAERARKLTETAQALADDFWSRNPGKSKSAAADYVFRHWPKDWGTDEPNKNKKPSKNTIRQRIVKT